MARTEARTKTSLWTDNDDWRKLTARAQRTYWMLYSQPTINLCGVVALTVRKWAGSAIDETEDTVWAALDELEDAGFILVDRDHEEVLVRTFIRHDGVARSPKTLHAAERQVAGISSPAIRAAVETTFASLAQRPDGVSDTPSDRASDTPSHALSDTPRTRVRTDSVSSLQSPTPTPVSPSPTPERDVAHSAETGHRDDTQDLALTKRLANICTATNRSVAHSEAALVVCWALEHVDARIVDEAITYATQKPPTLPRGVAAVIAAKASDHGITMPAFRPLTRLA